MKNYTITVNGNVYDVTVEEKAAGAAPAAAPAPKAAAPAPKAPAAAPAPAPKAAGAGSIEVGESVKRGDAVIIIEAMKMEIPIVAPEDGTVASVDVAVGDAVEAGAVLATLN